MILRENDNIACIILHKVLTQYQCTHYRAQFGEDVMGIEQRKKENRSLYGFEMTMAEFLDVSALFKSLIPTSVKTLRS